MSALSPRSVGFALASLSLVFCMAATAAPSKSLSRADNASHSTLIVRGDQVSTEDLADSVAKAFAATGDGHLVVQPFNTIDGIDRALDGKADVAATARPAYFKDPKEAGLTFTPVAWDAVVLITNTANPVDNLTLRQVHDIYYGEIKNWSRVGGPDEPIDLDGVASPLDGVQYSFRQLILGNGASPVAVPTLFINVNSLQSEVSLDTKALAVSTLSHALGRKNIKILPIEGVTPSLATLENGSYPLPLRIYLAYKPDSPKLQTIQALLDFLRGGKAMAILRHHHLLPYSQAYVLNSRSELDRINTIGARMVAEGMRPSYAPGNEFAYLARQYPGLEQTARLEEVAADQVAKADQQRIALAEEAGVNPSPRARPAAATYTVASGDTLSKIAQKHSVSVEDLRKWNDLKGNLLKVGQVLKLSPPR